MEPLVTAIIPTKNEEKNIAACLRSIKNQTYPDDRVEIIVADNFSADRTKEIAGKFTSLLFEAGPERSAQRNFGLEKAGGRYVIFLDADMELSSGVISECVKMMKSDPEIVGLYVPEVISGERFWCRARRFERGFYDATVIDGLRFIRTDVARKIGGFDEKLFAAEDWDLDKRLKKEGRTGIVKSPLYHHEEDFGLKKYIRKKAYYSTNFDVYIDKWGRNDPDVRKQFSFFYRYFGVFWEQGKWKRLLSHPILTGGMYILRFMVGVVFLLSRLKLYSSRIDPHPVPLTRDHLLPVQGEGNKEGSVLNDPKYSILIPTYNGAGVIKETLGSILSQSFQNFEIIIQDDASKDNTLDVIRAIGDSRIKIFQNVENLGYPKNLDSLSRKATGDIIYLMGQDDILAEDALRTTYEAFKISDDIGAVARPYYWFHDRIDVPVRATGQLNPKKDEIVTIRDSFDRILLLIDVAGQLSGLAMRRKFIDRAFHEDIFPCHVYPFISILKKHPIVFLKDYNLAVRIQSSQCRSVSAIYDKSPLESWVDFFNDVFSGKEYEKFRKYAIKNYVAKNYVGLIQIRNYAKYRYLAREIWYLLRYRWENIYSVRFWFFSAGCMLTPAFILIPLVDWYKSRVMAKGLAHLKIKYSLLPRHSELARPPVQAGSGM